MRCIRCPGHRRRRPGYHRRPRYLVMVQVHGKRVRECLLRLSSRIGIHRNERRKPHITLAGTFTLKKGTDPLAILRAVEGGSEGKNALNAVFKDFTLLRGKKGWAVAVRAGPGPAFSRLHTHLMESLSRLFDTCTWIDRSPRQRIFHVTIGFGLPRTRAESLLQLLKNVATANPERQGDRSVTELDLCRLQGTCSTSIRIGIVRNGALWKEYDLSRAAWLDRAGIFSGEGWILSLEAFRIKEGFELTGPGYRDRRTVFLISDLHLGHENIITYTSRPFPDVATMDRVLVRNWNFSVRSDDEIYFIGDLCHGKNARPASEYLSLLNGRIRFVAGNHDRDVPGAEEQAEMEYRGLPFLLVHDPLDAPDEYPGYVIHGHTHNNQCGEYPFLNMELRRVNVSAELVGYVPVSLDELVCLIGRSPPGARFITLNDAREACGLKMSPENK